MAQFAVAVTGGVASGKSAVCDRLAALGASVIDADLISRELVEPGQPALAEIVAAFGADMLDEHGALRRRLMRERIFGDAPARARLEAILHPRVRLLLRERALAASGRYAVLAIPLLIETGHYSWLDRIVAIDVPEAIQLDRLMQRDGVDIGLAQAMLQAQASRQQRLAIASDVVINDADLGTLERICDRLHHWLLDRAMQAARGD